METVYFVVHLVPELQNLFQGADSDQSETNGKISFLLKTVTVHFTV